MKKNKDLFGIINNVDSYLSDRIQSVQSLNLHEGSKEETIVELKQSLNRKKPKPRDIMDWDDTAAENVIDLHLIHALNKLGDESFNYKVPDIIAHAGHIMTGPYDELMNASEIVKSINSPQLTSDIVKLLRSNDEQTIKNVVSLFYYMDLPDTPIGGDIYSILPDSDLEITFASLKEKMNIVSAKSNGKIHFSDQFREFLDNSRVRESITVKLPFYAYIIGLPSYNCYFFIENKVVNLCTYGEAIERWIDWWAKRDYKI